VTLQVNCCTFRLGEGVEMSISFKSLFLTIIALVCCVARASVMGCPNAPITFANALKLNIIITEDGMGSQSCSFTVMDFDLKNADVGSYIILDPGAGAPESDRFVVQQLQPPGFTAQFCFASDPSTADCVKSGVK
jgi:hypothetical protein